MTGNAEQVRQMPKHETLPIAQIYIPAKRRGAVNPQVVRELAESMLEIGQQTPVLVRRDGGRLVLVEGLHRLEACKALGEETIIGCLIQAEAERPRAPPAYEADAETLRQKTDRLRMLRLEKEAAERSFAPSAASPNGTITTRIRTGLRRSGDGHSKSKPATLSEWLAAREHDGLRD